MGIVSQYFLNGHCVTIILCDISSGITDESHGMEIHLSECLCPFHYFMSSHSLYVRPIVVVSCCNGSDAVSPTSLSTDPALVNSIDVQEDICDTCCRIHGGDPIYADICRMLRIARDQVYTLHLRNTAMEVNMNIAYDDVARLTAQNDILVRNNHKLVDQINELIANYPTPDTQYPGGYDAY